ncbi:hypothetical protein MWU49_07090 [Alcanivorax sp. S6407]|uniref:hypothetical protein n=1 Tax=Alcanivorax sp. S6407 TaxID=2926424 RepID=UPI001FF42451|nr:hypothetical protein [Alcanivorax sp. S6407]MCK0153460.1 hypothetical protein [Alcanivorax sp. S6407]
MRRFLKWIPLILIIAFVGRAGVLVWHQNDIEGERSREFILSNEEVGLASGGVSEIIFRRKVSYNGSSSDPSYVEFRYRVIGNRNDLIVVIRGYGEPPKYSVREMETL